MADEIIEAPPAPPELTLEQELEKLKPAAATTPEAPLGTAEVTPPVTPAPVVEPPVEDLEAKLAKLTETPKPEAGTLNEDQKRIMELVPNRQAAESMVAQVNGYAAFTDAFARGDFDSVEQMFQQWNPQAYAKFLSHVYMKKVESGEWVDQWADDKEVTPAVKRLRDGFQARIAELETHIAKQTETRETQAQAEARNRAATNYMNHLTGLFDKIEFAEGDRRWVMADIHDKVSRSATTRSAINGGNMDAVNTIFAQAVREYVGRDKALKEGQAAVLKGQEVKKPLIPASPIVPHGALPGNIDDVPKDKRDEWMTEQLNALKARSSRK